MNNKRSFNYEVVMQGKQQAQTEQEERVNLVGVQGVSDLFIKSGERYRVRFLTPYSFGIDIKKHTIKENFMVNYVCEHQFSYDPATFCPICVDANEIEDEQEKNKMKQKTEKHFLVYVYDWENQEKDVNGNKRQLGPLAILRVGRGDKHSKNWTALEELQRQWGLTNIDIEIEKQGVKLDTQVFFRAQPVTETLPDGRITQVGTTFDYNRIMGVLKNVPNLPKEPGVIDITNRDHVELVNSWGNFFLEAGKYRMIDSYKKPRTEYKNNAPYTGTHQTAITNPVGTYPVQQPTQPNKPAYQSTQYQQPGPPDISDVPWD